MNQWQPITLKELGSLLVCETGSPSRLIERLVKDRLVDKVADPKDGRYVLLQLTETGTQKVQAIRQIEEQVHDDLSKLFSDEELSLVNNTLEKMLSCFSVAEALIHRKFMKPRGEGAPHSLSNIPSELP
ncbi:DNA-binding MarR family transcriptional regulator [Paenibacillus forsythiae]|uniref:DNA-binding MarR family transcriptional regulator n=1 Tax=Paenibacillus forsythiae TaxID=365616 RepID=A0ABU3H3Q9_9BACL|nr:DNA-binding MarR family transcriptional regulator [Paenibacillus forsythiae]